MSAAHKDESPVAAGHNVKSQTQKHSHFIARSTSTEAQYERVLMLLQSGSKNTMELRRAGVMMPAARIKEMNEKRGYTIVRVDLVDLWDEWGYLHPRIAVYELQAVPEMVGAA